MKIILMMLSVFLLGGCGTILTPKTKDINVNSERPVEIWLDGESLVSVGKINNFSVNNRKKGGGDYLILRDLENPDKEYRVDLERKFNRMTLLNLSLFLGAVGYPVDMISGATGKLEKTNYEITDFTFEN